MVDFPLPCLIKRMGVFTVSVKLPEGMGQNFGYLKNKRLTEICGFA